MNLNNELLDMGQLGAGLAWPPEVDTSGDLRFVDGVDNLELSIINIITTPVGERVMAEDFGTQVPRAVFENPTVAADLLPQAIVEAIRRYEPRVTSVTCKARVEGTVVSLTIGYKVKLTGQVENLVFPFNTNPARRLWQTATTCPRPGTARLLTSPAWTLMR
jgi:phage baseplate assembly protein W